MLNGSEVSISEKVKKAESLKIFEKCGKLFIALVVNRLRVVFKYKIASSQGLLARTRKIGHFLKLLKNAKNCQCELLTISALHIAHY